MWSRFPWNIHITKSLFPFHVNFPVAKAISCTYRISQSSISCANLFPFLPFRFFCPFLLVVFFFFCSLPLMTQLWQGGVAMKGEGCGWPGHLLTGPGAKIEWKKKRKKIAPPPVERRASVLSKCSRVSDWTRVHGLPGAMRTLWRREGVLSRGGNLRGWPVGAV